MCRITLRPPYRLVIGRARYPLWPGEHRLLLVLMGSQVCRKDKLIQALYPGSTIQPLTVEVVLRTYIAGLRRKLKGHWIITAHQGRGWTLEKHHE
jgi:DNA-binding response OmpR family regulator